MPASLTRTCPVCTEEKVTPDDFREVGVTGRGRPPLVCRSCRHEDPRLQSAYEEQTARRSWHRQDRARRIARTPAQVAATRSALRPDGLKLCPDGSGCGRALPFAAFSPNRSQRDGLEPLCNDCREEHARVRALRSRS